METFTSFSKRLLNLSAQEASGLYHNIVDSEHLLIVLAKQDDNFLIDKILLRNGLDSDFVTEQVLKLNPKGKSLQNMFTYSDNIKKIFEDSITLSRQLGFNNVGLEHVLLSILKNNNLAKYILNKNDIYDDYVEREIIDYKNKIDLAQLHKVGQPNLDGQGENGFKTHQEKKEGELEKFTKNITHLAKENQLDIITMRDEEIERVTHILARREKNTPLIVGESGVGKTALIYGLAQKIVKNEVPEFLKHNEILQLDVSKVISGTKYKGELEERIGKLLEEIKNRSKTIIFIDNFQSLSIIASQENTAEAGNMLKQALVDKQIKIIGVCSTSDYKRYIFRDHDLKRRLQEVDLNEPSIEQAISMIAGNISTLQDYYDLDIPKDTIEYAVKYSKRYLSTKFLPDSAIDILDETAASKVVSRNETYLKIRDIVKQTRNIQDNLKHLHEEDVSGLKKDMEKKLDDLAAELSIYESADIEKYDLQSGIRSEDIAATISIVTGIPVEKISKSETKKILSIDTELARQIIGQKSAVDSVSRAIKRSRTGIKDPRKPIGSFIFIGPTGVGKTELAKALARQLFDDENALIRLDMSEYSQPFDATKIIGSPPGYVGHKEGGQLTEQVLKKPYSIVLFDEIEKAHPEIFNLLLQILDEGTLTDSKGVKVDFKNTIIIMTSNLGATKIMNKNTLGFSNIDEKSNQVEKDQEFKNALKKYFKAEFLNRVDEVISFRQLSREDVGKIIKLFVEKLQDRLTEKQILIDIDEKAVELLVKIGFSEEYGARPLNRAIQTNIEDVLAQKILLEEIKPKNTVQITANEDKFDFNVVEKEV